VSDFRLLCLDKDGVLEFTIDFENPERNYGFFVTLVKNVIVGDERMDAFVIVKPLYDPRDVKPD
jgi:hypothetical protein